MIFGRKKFFKPVFIAGNSLRKHDVTFCKMQTSVNYKDMSRIKRKKPQTNPPLRLQYTTLRDTFSQNSKKGENCDHLSETHSKKEEALGEQSTL